MSNQQPTDDRASGPDDQVDEVEVAEDEAEQIKGGGWLMTPSGS